MSNNPPQGIDPKQVPNGWQLSDEDRKAKPEFAPVRAMASERFQKNIWAGVAVVSLLFGTVSPVLIAMHYERVLNARQFMFAIDGANTIHSGPMERVNLQSQVLVTTAINAAQALLQRSPVGLDLPEMVSGLCFADPRQPQSIVTKLNADVEAQMPDIKVRNLHQKPEIGKVTALSEKGGYRILEVRGQLIRAGNIEGRPSRILLCRSNSFFQSSRTRA